MQTLKVNHNKKKPVGIAKAAARWSKGSKADIKALQNVTAVHAHAEDAEGAMNPIDVAAGMANIDEACEDLEAVMKAQT